MAWQQFTGPITAKGVEDSALYVYNRLVSLNEVGSDPTRFGVEPNISLNWIAKEMPIEQDSEREHYLEAFRRAGLD